MCSTKKSPTKEGRLISGAELIAGLEASLERLNTDYVDIYHLHGVREHHYDHALAELLPAMLKLRDQGKIRLLGITEGFSADTKHVMMERAARDPHWDVMMVGFSILNQSARERVLVETSRQDIGVLRIFAVRDALSRPAKLREMVAELVQQGLIDGAALDAENPLGLSQRGGREPAGCGLPLLPRRSQAMHVILSGTGNLAAP